ncbi:PDZ domain-containing protein [Acidobacteriota bacterium]
MANIDNLLRTVKREYNVDDDRVWMGGFSDGGSAAFFYAMVASSDYAAFLALSGHMGVGSLDGDMPTYATNFFNSPVYAVCNDEDRLYPAEKMRVTIDMAMRAGGDILFKAYEGGHDFTYGEAELPRMARFLERHPRNPFPATVMCEAAQSRFGVCRWFAIDCVSPEEPAPWHTDHNVALVSDSISVGIYPDYEFEGPGVKVPKLVEGSAAEKMGMKEDDIIVKAGQMEVKNLDDVTAYKARFKRGDAFELTVKRKGKEIELKGRFPDAENYFVFKREQPSAMAKVSFAGNRIEVEGSRLGAFRILVHPDMIRFDQDLNIVCNGMLVYSKKITPDLEFMLRNFLENRDRRLLYVAEVKIYPNKFDPKRSPFTDYCTK